MNIHNPGNKSAVYSPVWLASNLELPKDRATINAWCRSFYALDPDVHRIINQHATLMMKYLHIGSSSNDDVDLFFAKMNNSLNLKTKLEMIVIEYLIMGEAFIYTPLDESEGVWADLMIQNPDYILVKRTTTSSDNEISLRPDENIRRMVHSSDPEDKFKVSKLNSKIIDDIKQNKNISLNNFNVTHLARKVSPYEIRGTSVLNSLFRVLQKVERTPEDTAILKSSLWDIENVGSGNHIVKDVIVQRYLHMFEVLSGWLENKIFQPISKINSFYEIKGAKKELMYPKVTFDTAQLIRDIKA